MTTVNIVGAVGGAALAVTALGGAALSALWLTCGNWGLGLSVTSQVGMSIALSSSLLPSFPLSLSLSLPPFSPSPLLPLS